MHARVFAEFDRICRERGAGGDVLEIGAVAPPDSLLCLPALAGARSRIGVNLTGDAGGDGWRIVGANANDLGCFADASFDTVLSNSVFEHDPYFWRSLREMRRVARPGALIAVGVPGYAADGSGGWLQRLARLPVLGAAVQRSAAARLAATATLRIHNFPGDYYRFSEQAVRDVLLDGLVEREVRGLLSPPRFVGAGIVPARPA
jgi:SAM-dependent methyltransferase